jgi:O-antigen ligase
MLGLYVLLLCSNWQEYRPRWSWLSAAVAIFLASFTTSTFTGVDPYHSFWDNHERMLGLFTIAHYILYYFICASFFKTKEDWFKALKIFLIAGTGVMMVGILQVGNPNFLLNQGSDRIIGTLGNAIYIGGYGLFLVFVALILFLHQKKEKFDWQSALLIQIPSIITLLFALNSRFNPSEEARVSLMWIGYIIVFIAIQAVIQFFLYLRKSECLWKWFVAIDGVIAFLGLLFSGTRGTLLALFVAIFIALVWYALILKQKPKLRLVCGGLALSGIIVVGLLVAFRTSPVVLKIPAINRLANTSVDTIVSGPRIIAWKIAVESVKDRPVFGWGPNNFFFAFNKYYNPRSLEYSYGETWFDNAHNIILNTLSVQGIVGLVSYICIFIAGIAVLIVGYRRSKEPHMMVITSVFLIAHLLQNITVFENPTSYLYFMFSLALITTTEVESRKLKFESNGQGQTVLPDRKVGAGSIGGVVVVSGIVLFLFTIQPLRANQKSLDVIKTFSSDPVKSIPATEEVFAFPSPHIDDIRSDISRNILLYLGDQKTVQSSKPEDRKKLFDISYAALRENIKLHPLDIRNHLNLAQLLQDRAVEINSTEFMIEAENIITEAVKLSPRRQQTLYMQAMIKLYLSKNDEAVTIFKQAIADDQKIAESYWRLAYVYTTQGKMKEAEEVLNSARSNGARFDNRDEEVVGNLMRVIQAPTTTTAATGSRR